MFLALVFSMRLARCFSTVRSEIESWSAMILIGSPLQDKLSTSCSLLEKTDLATKVDVPYCWLPPFALSKALWSLWAKFPEI